MNELGYSLSRQDLVEFQMYHSNNSPHHRRKKGKYRYGFPIIYAIIAFLFLIDGQIDLGLAFLILVVVWLIFFPKVLKKIYRKHFEAMLDESNNQGLKGEIKVELKKDGIFTKSSLGESKYDYKSVEKIVESKNCIYAYIGKAMALIFPKDKFEEKILNEFIQALESRTSLKKA